MKQRYSRRRLTSSNGFLYQFYDDFGDNNVCFVLIELECSCTGLNFIRFVKLITKEKIVIRKKAENNMFSVKRVTTTRVGTLLTKVKIIFELLLSGTKEVKLN